MDITLIPAMVEAAVAAFLVAFGKGMDVLALLLIVFGAIGGGVFVELKYELISDPLGFIFNDEWWDKRSKR